MFLLSPFVHANASIAFFILLIHVDCIHLSIVNLSHCIPTYGIYCFYLLQ